jgi:hypothetical protein
MNNQLETNTENLRPCGCGRSATGFCTGLHRLSDEEWDAKVFDEAFLNNKEKSQNES